jgi:hypothetical protein
MKDRAVERIVVPSSPLRFRSLRVWLSVLFRSLVAATLIAVLLALLFTPSAGAATWLISPDGTGDFPTIQAALDAAVDEDEVVLASGTFTGTGNYDLTFHGRKVVLRSETGQPADAVIDCQHHGRAFRFLDGETRNTRVEGITITNAYLYEGSPGGGAVLCQNSSPTFRACSFTECTCPVGGAFSISGGGPRIEHCTFYRMGNVVGTGCTGGAISVWYSALEVADCSFRLCVSSDGGVFYSIGSTIRVDRSVLEYNVGDGSAIWADGTTLYLTNSTLNHNLLSEIHLGYYGSALYADHSIIAFGDHAAVLCDGSSSATLSCCDVFGHPGGDWVGCLEGQDHAGGNLALDPLFCGGSDASLALRPDSPCAAENNAECGQIGALGVDCAISGPSGACCLSNGTCRITGTDGCPGVWMGAGIECNPNPCESTATETTSWGRIKAGWR